MLCFAARGSRVAALTPRPSPRRSAGTFCLAAGPLPARGIDAPFEFPTVNRVCYGAFPWARGCLTAQNGGFRPLVPPPAWSTIYYYKMLPVPVLPYLTAAPGPGRLNDELHALRAGCVTFSV